MNIPDLLNNILYVILTLVLPLVLKQLIDYKKVKIAESEIITEITKNKNISKIINDTINEVMDAVLYVNQTYADSLKLKGEFTKDAHNEAFKKAYEIANELITSEAKYLIDKLYGSFDLWLSTKIETSVNKTKKE